MTTRSPLSLAAFPSVLIATLLIGSTAAAAGQDLGPAPATDGPRPPAVPERTAFPRPAAATVGPVTPTGLTRPLGAIETATRTPASSPVVLEAAVDADHAPAPERRSRTPELRRILDVAIVSVGSALVAGALTDYAAGSVHWGMNAPELGAFGAGAALATWGGLRVAGWSGGAR